MFFDADGDGTVEQALGGLSFVSNLSTCQARWWATAVAPDFDGDGWNDTGERRLGSSTTHVLYIPEHLEVPVTARYGLRPCQDSADNDHDGQLDGDEADGPDPGAFPDCKEAVAFAYLPVVTRGAP